MTLVHCTPYLEMLYVNAHFAPPPPPPKKKKKKKKKLPNYLVSPALPPVPDSDSARFLSNALDVVDMPPFNSSTLTTTMSVKLYTTNSSILSS